jgi:hypothetical protein
MRWAIWWPAIIGYIEIDGEHRLSLQYRAVCRLWVDAVEKLGDEYGARNNRIRANGCLNRCCVRDSSFE